jgi:photosystem II stability/assembly factor-like uncharacterized protein
VTWQNAFAVLDQPLAAVSVVVAAQTVFVGVKGAVLRSEDAGESWHITALASPPPLVVALVISPAFADDSTLIAGTAEDGVFVSTDRGDTWIPWNFALIDLNVYALAISPTFAQDRTVFAGTESGIFRSSNGGRGWREVPFPMDAAPVLCLNLTSGGRLFAGTESHGLFISDDLGASWQPIKLDTSGGAIHAIDAIGAEISVLLEDRLLRSADGGQSWTLPTPVFQPDQSAMTLLTVASDHLLVGFADGNIRRIAP